MEFPTRHFLAPIKRVRNGRCDFWGQLFLSALGGGFTVKVLDILYQEFRLRKTQSQTASEFVDKHLDPLLKAADEFVGKLRSLSETDFKPIRGVVLGGSSPVHSEFVGLLYLLGRFWAQAELIRYEGMSVAMSKDKRGAQLQSFLDCLEARRVRILDRASQRAVGEVFLRDKIGISYVECATVFQKDGSFRQWVLPLATFLSRMKHTSERQKLLQYGVVVHALIDTLEPLHSVTRDRPSWPNKLSKRSWRDLNYRVFRVYLKSVRGRHKYLGPPKRAALKGEGSTKRLWDRLFIFGSGTSVGLPLLRSHRKGASSSKHK